ncbi:hypothetical protein SLT36_22795 [Aminobacter sp. BA135]|uniref:hypothetical protein n=1 Tax=Aminobacter sp. BA135 TaxID=537596 RepID=UPI003D7A6EF5
MQVDDLFHLGGIFFEKIIQAIYSDRLRLGDVVDAGVMVSTPFPSRNWSGVMAR